MEKLSVRGANLHSRGLKKLKSLTKKELKRYRCCDHNTHLSTGSSRLPSGFLCMLLFPAIHLSIIPPSCPRCDALDTLTIYAYWADHKWTDVYTSGLSELIYLGGHLHLCLALSTCDPIVRDSSSRCKQGHRDSQNLISDYPS